VTENAPVSWPADTVKETVVVAPTGGTLVVVEVEGLVDVDGADDPVVVVGGLTAWFRALEHAVATIARAIRATPEAVLPFMTELTGLRGWTEA
jgi:hypothetical protein